MLVRKVKLLVFLIQYKISQTFKFSKVLLCVNQLVVFSKQYIFYGHLKTHSILHLLCSKFRLLVEFQRKTKFLCVSLKLISFEKLENCLFL